MLRNTAGPMRYEGKQKRMKYTAHINQGQYITVENIQAHTTVTIATSASGQQQAQQSSLHTGEWSAPPALFRTHAAIILRIETHQGHYFYQIQHGSVQNLPTPPALSGVEVLPLHPVASSPQQQYHSMEPMKPMVPMVPMKPMSMNLGSMHMSIGQTSTQPQPEHRFCSQCGQPVQPADRFCSLCGHRLTPSEG